MPDWLTHAVLGLLVAEIFSVRKKSLVVLGALLPDIFPKLVLLRLLIPLPHLNYTGLGAFHTPFVFFLATIIIAPLFRYSYWKFILWLNLGAATHFFSDALLRHFAAGVHLFYPISLGHFTLNVVWPDESYWVLIPALLLYGVVLWYNENSPLGAMASFRDRKSAASDSSVGLKAKAFSLIFCKKTYKLTGKTSPRTFGSDIYGN